MIPIEAIEQARRAIDGTVIRTPLVRLNVEDAPAEIYLKLENLQPIGSFKLRGAANSLGRIPADQLASGVLTASAGNWAQGLAWMAKRLGIPCTIIVPDTAPETKLLAIERLGARHIAVPFERWWQCMQEHRFEGVEGRFCHPVEDEAVMAGNGTIGLELLEDLPDVDTVLIPWGGGGLSTGIASALRQRSRDVRIYGVEVETAAPLHASLNAGEMKTVTRTASFVDGIGSERLLPKMWPFAQELLDGAFTASVEEIASAIRLLAERNRVIAEGAGGCPVAVALAGKAGLGKVLCVVSGGNLDSSVLRQILAGVSPG